MERKRFRKHTPLVTARLTGTDRVVHHGSLPAGQISQVSKMGAFSGVQQYGCLSGTPVENATTESFARAPFLTSLQAWASLVAPPPRFTYPQVLRAELHSATRNISLRVGTAVSEHADDLVVSLDPSATSGACIGQADGDARLAPGLAATKRQSHRNVIVLLSSD